MLQTLVRLFDYDDWANGEALRSLRATSAPQDRAVRLLAHIAAAKWLWLDRIEGKPQSCAVWPDWKLEESEAQLPRVHEAWRSFLTAQTDADLAREFAYTNTKGDRFRNRVGDASLHVAMHGAYHRGQIAQLVRQHGAEPAYTDFIQAVRTGKV